MSEFTLSQYEYGAKTLDETLAEKPNTQMLIDQHEVWLCEELRGIGIDATDTISDDIFRNMKVPNNENKQKLREIKAEAQTSARNILHGLLCYEATEFSSQDPSKLRFVSRGAIVEQQKVLEHMRSEHDRRVPYWSFLERYESLLTNYGSSGRSVKGEERRENNSKHAQPRFTFQVNEHYSGAQGMFDYTDSGLYCSEIQASFNPKYSLFTVSFPENDQLLGWYDTGNTDGKVAKVVEPRYKLSYMAKVIRDLNTAIKTNEQAFIGIRTWRAY